VSGQIYGGSGETMADNDAEFYGGLSEGIEFHIPPGTHELSAREIAVESEPVAAAAQALSMDDEAGATASRGQLEGSAHAYSGAETAKKARRDSYLKIEREQGEKLYVESRAQFVSAHQSTLTRMEAYADEEIIQADTVVDDELEEAKAGFDRTEQETKENLKRQHEMEEQERALVMDQKVKEEEGMRDVDKRQRENAKHELQLEYEARFAALKQEYQAVQEANDRADEEAHKNWWAHMLTVLETHRKEKADSARTRLEQTHACNDQLKTKRDTALGILKEQLETERDGVKEGIRGGLSKKVRDATEKHRESLEVRATQRRAEVEKIRVEEDAESVTDMNLWVDIKKQRRSISAAPGRAGGMGGLAESAEVGAPAVASAAVGGSAEAAGGAGVSLRSKRILSDSLSSQDAKEQREARKKDLAGQKSRGRAVHNAEREEREQEVRAKAFSREKSPEYFAIPGRYPHRNSVATILKGAATPTGH
jgi:hypothetical protein